MNFDNRIYCNDCGACGESGCCSVYKCGMTENCKYKDLYFQELKESYSLLEKLQNVFYDKLPQELKDEFDKIEKENWEEWNKIT